MSGTDCCFLAEDSRNVSMCLYSESTACMSCRADLCMMNDSNKACFVGRFAYTAATHVMKVVSSDIANVRFASCQDDGSVLDPNSFKLWYPVHSDSSECLKVVGCKGKYDSIGFLNTKLPGLLLLWSRTGVHNECCRGWRYVTLDCVWRQTCRRKCRNWSVVESVVDRCQYQRALTDTFVANNSNFDSPAGHGGLCTRTS